MSQWEIKPQDYGMKTLQKGFQRAAFLGTLESSCVEERQPGGVHLLAMIVMEVPWF